MNTIMIVPRYAGEILASKTLKGTAYLLSPGSLHRAGEIYIYQNGVLLKQDEHGDYHISDLLLPRQLEDELHQLATEYRTFLIRTPAIGLGSHRMFIHPKTRVPMLALADCDSLENLKPKTRTKHVSKPHTN